MIPVRSLPAVLSLLGSLLIFAGCGKADLPEYGDVPRFAMTDQAGSPFTSESLKGRVWAAAFVFTRCPTMCPRVTRAMRNVQVDAAQKGVPLHLVSFSVDPDNDTPEVLRQYAKAYQANLASWSFATGDAAKVRETAERGFKIAVEGSADPAKADFGITHGTQLVLVDTTGKIRGYYATNEPQALADLVSAAARLVP
jgi:protein SCO1/2